jgi:hypothetical protein
LTVATGAAKAGTAKALRVAARMTARSFINFPSG